MHVRGKNKTPGTVSIISFLEEGDISICMCSLATTISQNSLICIFGSVQITDWQTWQQICSIFIRLINIFVSFYVCMCARTMHNPFIFPNIVIYMICERSSWQDLFFVVVVAMCIIVLPSARRFEQTSSSFFLWLQATANCIYIIVIGIHIGTFQCFFSFTSMLSFLCLIPNQ